MVWYGVQNLKGPADIWLDDSFIEGTFLKIIHLQVNCQSSQDNTCYKFLNFFLTSSSFFSGYHKRSKFFFKISLTHNFFKIIKKTVLINDELNIFWNSLKFKIYIGSFFNINIYFVCGEWPMRRLGIGVGCVQSFPGLCSVCSRFFEQPHKQKLVLYNHLKRRRSKSHSALPLQTGTKQVVRLLTNILRIVIPRSEMSDECYCIV